MPVFALAFGSFGDILATIQLAIRIAVLLRQSGSPSPECEETVQELKALSSQLDLAHSTLQETPETALTPVVAEQIQNEVAQCHRIMARFFNRLVAPQSFLKRIWLATAEEKLLAAFRTQIIERKVALGVVVGLINSGALRAVEQRVFEVSGEVDHGIRDINEGVMVVRNRVDEVGGQVRRWNDTVQDCIAQVREQVNEGNHRILGVDEGVMIVRARVDEVGSQIRLGNDVMSGLASQLAQVMAVITHVPHGISHETFRIVSPTGITIPIPILFCRSYKDLHRILKAYFSGREDIPGASYITSGHYAVEDRGSTTGPFTLVGSSHTILSPDEFVDEAGVGACLEIICIRPSPLLGPDRYTWIEGSPTVVPSCCDWYWYIRQAVVGT
ncbi:hypothetical protein C8F01DRAFT_1260832 [Mycena amicta]|nr:hypothetical protein C8F01DRAFT_1260832 [Mycena amicta]